MKRNILGMFGIFLVMMLLFTVVSRAADSFTVARVTTAKAETGKISHSVTGSGIVEANREQAVSTLSGQIVKHILVEEGQSVKAGDVLFELDPETLAEQILTQKQEMEKEDLLSGDKASSRAAKEQSEAVAKNRAAEDYDTAARNADTQISRAAKELEAAKAKRSALDREENAAGESTAVEEALQKTLEEKQEAYDRAVKEKEELEASIEEKVQSALEENNLAEPENQEDPGVLEQQIRRENQPLLDAALREIEEKEQEVQQAQAALYQYQEEKEADSQNTLEELKQQMDEEVKAKQQAYEDAVEAARESLQGAQRALEDAQAPDGTDSTGEIDAITREQAQLQLDKLERLQEAEGKVTAPVDGVIVRINLTVGDRTPDGTAVLMTDLVSGKRLRVEVPAQQRKYVAKNDTAKVNADGKKQEWDDLVVDAVRESEKNSNMLEVTVLLPEDSMEPGEAASLTVTRTSKRYECCIPVGALHIENGKYFVYVIREKDSILGKELTAQRLDVTVLDKNEINAALQEGDVSSDDTIILSSEKEISAGSRVRTE